MAWEEHILIVEDDPALVQMLSITVSNAGYRLQAAQDGNTALMLLEQDNFSVALLDMQLPGVSGVELIKRMLEISPDLAIIVQTGMMDLSLVVECFQEGAYDYLTKPYKMAMVPLHIERALEKRRLTIENRIYHESLQELIEQRTKQLQNSYNQTILALSAALDYRDNETQRHAERVVHYSMAMGKAMGMNQTMINQLEWGAMLHDVGKIGVPDSILRKPGPLTDDERVIMQNHVELGCSLLKEIDFLAGAMDVVRYHHEWFNGTGYPHGLSEHQIPIQARIFAIADVFDALTSERPYRSALSVDAACEIMHMESGSHFDPFLLDLFFKLIPDFCSEDPELKLPLSLRAVGT